MSVKRGKQTQSGYATRSLFENVTDDEISQEAFTASGKAQATFYNYVNYAESSGLVERLKGDKKHPKRTTGVRLTDKGRQLLGRAGHVPVKAQLTPPADSADAHTETKPDMTSLDYSTEVTNAFNATHRYWKWKLVKEGEPMEQI